MPKLLPLALLLLAASAQAEVYRGVDPATGRTVISDTPLPGRIRHVTESGETSRSDDERNRIPLAIRQAAENFPVTLYTTPDCVAECKLARDLLNGRGVPFTEKMLQKPEEVAELKQLIGDIAVPTVKVGRQPIRGFLASGYNNLLDLAGYPKSAPAGSKPSGGLTP